MSEIECDLAFLRYMFYEYRQYKEVCLMGIFFNVVYILEYT